LADERYGHTEWDGAKEFLSASEQEEFEPVPPGKIADQFSKFWEKKN
jgi:hypothetical protein